MKKIYGFLIMCLSTVLFTGCSQYALVNSEVYNNADLAEYHTFRIVTPDEGKLPDGMQMVTYYNIAAAIREQMVERGYTEDASSPILVNIGLTVHKELETEPLAAVAPVPAPVPPVAVPPVPVPPGPVGVRPPVVGPIPPVYNGYYPAFIYPRQYYYPQAYYSNAQVITGMYKEGVLTMDIVNLQQHLPLYSASVATIMDGNGMGQFRNLEGIAQAVQTLFSKFPVPVLTQYKGTK
ncbi:MAG: DUF4136 domain-containing protein [Muribaculaceae bacterium]|nr:DUF4136 domain-containing protein [Muribaculaceae bacterium]